MAQGPTELAMLLAEIPHEASPLAPVALPIPDGAVPQRAEARAGIDLDREFDGLLDRLTAELELEFLRIYGTAEPGR